VQHNHPVTSEPTPSVDGPDSGPEELTEAALPTPGMLREGYDAEQVDEFLAELGRALRHDPPAMAPYEVADQRFKVRRTGRRYALRPVDEHLEQAQAVLRRRHGADAVAGLEGRVPEPRHVPTWWIYAVGLVLVALIVAVTVTQL
jgi:DivIVA domain-containing protein